MSTFKFKLPYFLLVLAIASQQILNAEGTDLRDFKECFADIEDGLAWPLEKKDGDDTTEQCDVSSVFGPSISTCTGDYRFNRGFTIHGFVGAEVYPSYDGTILDISFQEDAGLWAVTIEHEFIGGEECAFVGDDVDVSVTKFYTTYNHLKNVPFDPEDGIGTSVTAGETILGYLERCKLHCGVSLGFVLKLGATCSEAFATDYVDEHSNPPDCNLEMYDPHIIPWFALPRIESDMVTESEINEEKCWGETPEAGAMEIQSLAVSAACGGTDINRYDIVCKHGDDDKDPDEYTLDLNFRTGYDASSARNLHTMTTDVPYLDPLSFTRHHDSWGTKLIIPAEFFFAENGDDCCTITVTDIWGNSNENEVCGPAKNYIDVFEAEAEADKFAWPLGNYERDQIFSNFGPRNEYETGGARFHPGVDIKAEKGTSVLSVAKGVVSTIRFYNSGGNTVVIQHDFPEACKFDTRCGPGEKRANHWFTQYQHLDTYAPGLEVGQVVAKGQQIGTVGSTGEHHHENFLHFEVRFGTKSSLSYSQKYPEQEWSRFGYDPMIDPSVVFPKETFKVAVTKKHGADSKNAGIYNIEGLAHEAGVNTFRIMHATRKDPLGTMNCKYPSTYTVRQSYEIDLNRRIGFTGANNFHDTHSGLPHIVPLSTGPIPTNAAEAALMKWSVNIDVPREWMDDETSAHSHVIISVADSFGREICEDFFVGELD